MGFYSTPLLIWTKHGLYCEAGNFYIDPMGKVQTAVVTHAHSDHARRGANHYICEKTGVGLLKTRLGKNISVAGIPYQEQFYLGPVKVSLHSAGHILGSSQVKLELDGEVWVASGDYKRDPDPSCEPFQSISCDTFVTEATFGTPKYTWSKNINHGQDIKAWWDQNAVDGTNSILCGYSLGKAQRILAELKNHASKPVLIYSTMQELTECYRVEGRALAETMLLETRLKDDSPIKGELILAPPSVVNESWAIRLGNYKTAFASGWMQTSSGYYRGNYDHGFVMSDHADWNDLNQTIKETGAKRVFVQHRNGTLIRHLRKQGIDAHPVEVLTQDFLAKVGGTPLALF